MKNKLVLVLVLSITQTLIAQNECKVTDVLRIFNNDTINYIKQHIIASKNSYIGKPLDSLLKDLPAIIHYANEVPHKNRYICSASTLYFSSYSKSLDKISQGKNPLMVTITWANPIDNKEFPNLGLKLFGGEWTINSYNYFKDKLIGNIETFKQ